MVMKTASHFVEDNDGQEQSTSAQYLLPPIGEGWQNSKSRLSTASERLLLNVN
jgi:hypothetical protein